MSEVHWLLQCKSGLPWYHIDDSVGSPPTLKTQPSNSTMIAGSDANIACIAEGKPTPEVQWTFSKSFTWFNEGLFRVVSPGSMSGLSSNY